MQRYQRFICKLRASTFINGNPLSRSNRYCSTEKTQVSDEITNSGDEIERKKVELGGFAKAFEKFAIPEPKQAEEVQSFEHLIRHSKFVDLGDPEGKVVTGKIFHVVDNDLYIDFGWKFHCVCQRPVKNQSDYVRGAIVRIRIKDLELSTKFLGMKKDLTILEADCTLNALVSTPMRNIANI